MSTPSIRFAQRPRERTPSLSGAFGVGLPSPSHVPSPRFLTTSTACSTHDSQACCILLPILGFTGFLPAPSADGWRAHPHRCHTLQSLSAYKAASPSPGTVTLLPFQSCVPVLGGSGDFKVLLRASVRGEASSLPIGRTRCSLGLPAPGTSCLLPAMVDTLRDAFRRHHCRICSALDRCRSAAFANTLDPSYPPRSSEWRPARPEGHRRRIPCGHA